MLFRLAVPLLLASALHAQSLPPCHIETVAGGGISLVGDGGPALEADILQISDVAAGPDDSIYIADSGNSTIWRMFPDGQIEALPGAGALESLGTLAVGADGSVYFVERSARRIRRITPDGTFAHFAGNGSEVFSGDGGLAVDAGIGVPTGLDVGPDGSIYFAVGFHQRVRRVRPDGVVQTVAGSGPAHPNDGHYTGDGIPAIEARLNRPSDVAVAPDGSFYVADTNNYRIRHVDLSGEISTVAGLGERAASFPGSLAREAPIGTVQELTIGLDGLPYYMELSSGTFRVDAQGLVERLSFEAGNSATLTSDGRVFSDYLDFAWVLSQGSAVRVAGADNDGTFGDGGSPLQAALVRVGDMAIDGTGTLALAENLDRVRVVRDGIISSVAPLRLPVAVEFGPDGSLFVGLRNQIVRVSPSGETEEFAGFGGTCSSSNCGERGDANDSQLLRLRDLALDSSGVVFLIHRLQNRDTIRRIGVDRVLTTPVLDFGSDRAVPEAIGLDALNRLWILVGIGRDRSIWRWTPESGELESIFPVSSFLQRIIGFAVGPNGNVYLTENGRAAVWVLTPEGHLNVIAGQRDLLQERRRSGDGGLAADALLANSYELAVSLDGDLYIDEGDVIRRIVRAGDCPTARRPVIAQFGAVNGATFEILRSPGQIFSLFGRDLGPEDIATAQLVNGSLSTELAGVRILIDGVPAPLIFTSSGQLSGVLPYGTTPGLRLNDAGVLAFDRPSRFVVERDGVAGPPSLFYVQASAPGVFTADASGQGQAAALNEDGSLNSVEHPAARGSVVVLFATGEGQTDPPGVDGRLAAFPLPRPVLPVRVTANGQEVEVLYAGGAPGFTAGLMQLNISLPPDMSGTVEIVLHIGAQASRPVTVAVTP